MLARLLRRLFPRVTYVRNITDVEDKITARSLETGEPIGSITARTTADFHRDMTALGNLPPDDEPRATQSIGRSRQERKGGPRVGGVPGFSRGDSSDGLRR